jgi:hypothetical protein
MLRDLLRRVSALERQQVRLRVGEVTDLAPLDVAMGGSDVSYEDVNAVGPVADGEQVAALVSGGNLLVLGRLLAGAGMRFAEGTMAFPGASITTNTTVTHGLGRTPVAVMLTSMNTSHPMRSSNFTSTTFLATVVTRDGSSPAAATPHTFTWLAL